MKHLRRFYGLVSLSFFTIAAAAHEVLFARALGLSRQLSYYLLQSLSNATEVLLCVLGIAVAQRGRPRPLRELGLAAPVGRALAFALLATLPMSLGFALVSRLNPQLTLATIVVSTIIAPFVEEVLFRGYIFVAPAGRSGRRSWSHRRCSRCCTSTRRRPRSISSASSRSRESAASCCAGSSPAGRTISGRLLPFTR